MTTAARDAALIWLLEMAMTDPTMGLDDRQEARDFAAQVKAEIAAERAAEQEPARG